MKFKIITTIALAIITTTAQAEPGHDSWGDANVKEHFAGELALGVAGGHLIIRPQTKF